MPALVLHWHHGPDYAPETREIIHGKLRQFGMRDAEQANALMAEAGSMLVGTEGVLVGDDHTVKVTGFPHDKFATLQTTRPERIQNSQGIYRDWIDAIRGAKPLILADFENGGRLSEFIMLGNLATLYPGEPLTYDPVTGQITNHSEANRQLEFNYRAGWSL